MSKLVLGIDVGKKELSLALLKEKHLFSKKISNSESGFKAIEEFIFSHSSEKPEVYMEVTGNYSTPVADYLADHGYVVKVVNPQTKGKATKQIIVAVMKKIIHAIFAIMKKDSEFNEKLLFKNA